MAMMVAGKPLQVGNLYRQTAGEIAQRILSILRAASGDVVVTADSKGREHAGRDADADGVIAVYRYTGDMMGTYRALRDDIAAERAGRS
jgi:CO dehydrogenase nickel-insertion accessory protein CooC1